MRFLWLCQARRHSYMIDRWSQSPWMRLTTKNKKVLQKFRKLDILQELFNEAINFLYVWVSLSILQGTKYPCHLSIHKQVHQPKTDPFLTQLLVLYCSSCTFHLYKIIPVATNKSNSMIFFPLVDGIEHIEKSQWTSINQVSSVCILHSG